MKRLARISAFTLLAVSASALHAQDFTCANKEAQISCGDGACEIESEGFTPMSLSRNGEILEICAYSGCANGPITSRAESGGVEMLQARVAWVDRQDAGADRIWELLSVIHDAGEKVAQMRWGGIANVMTCRNPEAVPGGAAP